MLGKLSELAKKTLDVGTDLGKSAISTTQDLASQITETGKEKVREVQAKVDEYTSAVEKLEEIRLKIQNVRSGVSSLKVGSEYTTEELEDLFNDIEEILERK